MPEEPEIDAEELHDTLEELQEERAERKEEAKRESWIRYISLTTAVFAVVAAVAALHSGSLVNEALIAKSEAVIQQEDSIDQWTYYQEKATQATVDDATAELLTSLRGPAAAVSYWRLQAAHHRAEQLDAKQRATGFKEKRDSADRRSSALFEKHHLFALVVTFTQVSIALSAVAALTRRKPIWYISLIVGLGGIGLFIAGLLQSRLID